MKRSETRREPSAVADDVDDDVDDNFKVPPAHTRFVYLFVCFVQRAFSPCGTGEESRSVAQLREKRAGTH